MEKHISKFRYYNYYIGNLYETILYASEFNYYDVMFFLNILKELKYYNKDLRFN